MKNNFLFILVIPVLNAGIAFSQITNQSILKEIKTDIITTDEDSNRLVTNTGFNIYIQKKALNYLTGVSDLSLAKFQASYSTDNDKLNLGFNIPVLNPSSNRLAFIVNPILEADVKNSFTTLYKDESGKQH